MAIKDTFEFFMGLDAREPINAQTAEIFSKNVRIKVYDGIVWSTIPKKASKNIFFRLINNYHFADINLFWKDISENASNRVKYFIQQRTK